MRTARAIAGLSSRRPRARGRHDGGAPCHDAVVARKGTRPWPVGPDAGWLKVAVAAQWDAIGMDVTPRTHRRMPDPWKCPGPAPGVTGQAVMPSDMRGRYLRSEFPHHGREHRMNLRVPGGGSADSAMPSSNPKRKKMGTHMNIQRLQPWSTLASVLRQAYDSLTCRSTDGHLRSTPAPSSPAVRIIPPPTACPARFPHRTGRTTRWDCSRRPPGPRCS